MRKAIQQSDNVTDFDFFTFKMKRTKEEDDAPHVKLYPCGISMIPAGEASLMP